jgi:hypothetical protein
VVSGLVCAHCGKLAAPLNNAADENRALDEYHKQLQKLEPGKESKRLLESGFLPDNRDVLIEAGIYCVPLLKNVTIYESAASRLEAIILKLNLMPNEDRQTRRAVEDFQARIKQYKATKRSDDLYGIGCLLLIAAAIIAFGWVLIRVAGLSIALPLIIILVICVIYLLLKK